MRKHPPFPIIPGLISSFAVIPGKDGGKHDDSNVMVSRGPIRFLVWRSVGVGFVIVKWTGNMTRMSAGSLNGNGSKMDRAARFRTTRWSQVLNARSGTATEAQQAWTELSQAYWYPLYAFARRNGASTHDAQDLTQRFFQRLLEGNSLAKADRQRGRFRAFLLTGFRNFLTDSHRMASAEKRGGGRIPVSIDESAAEARYDSELVDDRSPDRLFEQKWAVVLLSRVVERLNESFSDSAKPELLEQLKPCLWGEDAERPTGELAERFGISESAVRVTLHRMRSRFRDLLEDEIAQTVASPDEIEDEIRHLMSVF